MHLRLTPVPPVPSRFSRRGRPHPSPAPAAALSAAGLTALQRSAGNRQTMRLLRATLAREIDPKVIAGYVADAIAALDDTEFASGEEYSDELVSIVGAKLKGHRDAGGERRRRPARRGS